MEQLIEVFPAWNKTDLRDVLDECNHDVLLAIDRISLGLVEKWHDSSSQNTKPTTATKRSSKDNNNSTLQTSSSESTALQSNNKNRDDKNTQRPTSSRGGGTDHKKEKLSKRDPKSFRDQTDTQKQPTDENTAPVANTSSFENNKPSFANRVAGKSAQKENHLAAKNNRPSSSAHTSHSANTTAVSQQNPANTSTSSHSISSSKPSWAQLVKGKEPAPEAKEVPTTSAAPAAESASKSAPAAHNKPVIEIIKKDRSAAVGAPATTTVVITKSSSPSAASTTINNAAAQISTLSPKKSNPATPISPAKIATAIAPPQQTAAPVADEKAAAQNANFRSQKPANRTLKQDAAVVMPNVSNVSNLGMRFGSLAIGAEQQQHVSVAQSVEGTPVASPSLAQNTTTAVPVHQQPNPVLAPSANIAPVVAHHAYQPIAQQHYAHHHHQQHIVPTVAPAIPVMPTNVASNVIAQQATQAQQKLPPTNANVNPAVAAQSSNMMPPMNAMAMQQMHSGFGLGHMGAADYSALYGSDPQTRAMLGYYDPSMTYGQSMHQRYPQDTNATASVGATAQGTSNINPAQQYNQQQQQQQQQQHGGAPGLQPSQPYPMPYPAYYPYYFAPNYGSNVYGSPYKNAAAPYGYPNPAASAAMNMNPQQQQQQGGNKGYYEDASGASTLGLDYNKYMHGQVANPSGNPAANAGPAGYANKPQRRYDNNAQVSAGASGPSQVASGLNNAGAGSQGVVNQQVVNPGQMGGMNQKGGNPAGGYYSYPQQRGAGGNTQYWTQ